MFFNKEVAICTAVVLALSVACTARPNQNERRIKSTSAQDLPSKLPWSPASGGAGGVMYLPEINAFLVPAESLLHSAAVSRPQLSVFTPQFALPPPLTVQQPPKRRRPIANFIKYINSNFPGSQSFPGSNNSPAIETKKVANDEQGSYEKAKTEINVNRFYGPGVSYFSSIAPQVPLYEDLTPKITEIDRTLSENDRLLEKITEDIDESTMILMGKGSGQGTRLTLRPVAKAVAGPRGVAVASPIAQAVLRRKDPTSEITYEPDSVAVAGPGGQAYSHPKLVITYIDEPTNSTDTSQESVSQPIESTEEETVKEEGDAPPNES